jgi:hypothetical protein
VDKMVGFDTNAIAVGGLCLSQQTAPAVDDR